jgi:Zn-finger nucleic acid-binding protein
MEGQELGSIHLELKYCERCGGLWLRLKGSETVFCRRCAKALAGLRAGFALTSRSADHDTAAQLEPVSNLRSRRSAPVTQVFWTEGGNA